ncbi:hypothetical protein AJ80_09808 [Polytolypa hystricis UAMH7299]|uniref:C2H2-type domain-containing protein n=1 Tax=Polytolypa hystricis (strain UAMH7299) TaxID=1447883 RepID=A0A2B7WJC1_POLH7|nr:hypothetical protein AJ80_09808 [Polytolypa hystricis UAMH7299]
MEAPLAEPVSTKLSSISDSSRLCLSSFARCLEQTTPYPLEHALIENQRGRFSLWASNIGVFGPGRGSLDYRLREVDHVHRLVEGLLESLNGLVETCISHTISLQPPKDSSVSDDEFADLKERYRHAVQKCSEEIRLLYQLSNSIRKASREAQTLRADSTYEIKDSEGKNIEEIIKFRFTQNLRDQFRHCSENLLERIATTMLLRRKRILYRWRYAPTRLPKSAPEPKIQNHIPQVHDKVERRTTTSKPTQSVMKSQVATELDPKKLENLSAPSVVSGKTIPVSSHDDLVFPLAPKAQALKHFRELKSQTVERHMYYLRSLPHYQEIYLKNNQQPVSSLSQVELDVLHSQVDEANSLLRDHLKDAWENFLETTLDEICPYCYIWLPKSTVRDENKWKDHVISDLDPYVCLFEDCSKPHQLYDHSYTWLSHMRQHLLQWHCETKSHGPKTFETQEEYMAHMKQMHKPTFTEPQLKLLAKRNGRLKGPLFQTCPFCGADPKDPESVKGRLEHHIVGHLRFLALKSLPRCEEDDDDQSAETSNDPNADKQGSSRQLNDLLAFTSHSSVESLYVSDSLDHISMFREEDTERRKEVEERRARMDVWGDGDNNTHISDERFPLRDHFEFEEWIQQNYSLPDGPRDTVQHSRFHSSDSRYFAEPTLPSYPADDHETRYPGHWPADSSRDAVDMNEYESAFQSEWKLRQTQWDRVPNIWLAYEGVERDVVLKPFIDRQAITADESSSEKDAVSDILDMPKSPFSYLVRGSTSTALALEISGRNLSYFRFLLSALVRLESDFAYPSIKKQLLRSEIGTEYRIYRDNVEQLLTGVVSGSDMKGILEDSGSAIWKDLEKEQGLKDRLKSEYKYYLSRVQDMERALKAIMETLKLNPDEEVRQPPFSIVSFIFLFSVYIIKRGAIR